MKKSATRLDQMILFSALCILVIGFQACNKKPKEKEETVTTPKTEMTSSQLSMTTNEIYGKELEYEFTDYVTIDLTYGSDTKLYWIERESKVDANEEISTIHFDEYTIMAGWNESDGTKVSLYSDFATGKTYGYQFFSDGRIRNLIGSIRLKSEVRK